MGAQRRCESCGAMSDLSVTTCWSCGEPLVPGAARATDPLNAQGSSPIHPSRSRGLIGPGVWAIVLVLLAVTFGAVWWIARGPERIDFPATLGGFDRNDDPTDEITREVYAKEGVSVNSASWGYVQGYTALILRDTPARAESEFMNAFVALGGDIDKPAAERTVDGVKFRCYRNGDMDAVTSLEGRTWCAWIDAGELGLLVHHTLDAPPLELAVQLREDIQA